MAVISKELFDKTCTDMDCFKMYHPWNDGCFMGNVNSYKESFIGSVKFYSIIYIAQIAMRGKKMLKSKREWQKMGAYFARSTLLGIIVSSTTVTQGCIFRRLQGNKLNYYTYILLPNIVNGLSIFLEPPSRRGLVINLFCNLLIEYWIKCLERANYILVDRPKQTFMFMIGSAALFYLMRLEGDKEKRTPLFWLFTPERVKRKSDAEDGVCPHQGPCIPHVAKGFFKLFGAGLAISLAKILVPRIKTPIAALAHIRRKDLNMAFFFGTYIGIYRAVICYLCRKQGKDSAQFALPAGYLAGLSFLFKPSLGISIASITAALKLYSTILYENGILSSKVPLPEIMYCICQGILFNSNFMDRENCPNYIIKLMKTVTNGCSDKLYANLIEAVTVVS